MGNWFGLSVAALLLAVVAVSPVGAGSSDDSEAARTAPGNVKPRMPLPKWAVENGRPTGSTPVFEPYSIELGSMRTAPTNGLIESPAEHTPMDGMLLRYGTSDWPGFVADLVAALTGDPTHDERAYVVVEDIGEQRDAEDDFLAAGADLTKVDFIHLPTDSVWLRDYGPHFIWHDGTLAVADSHYIRFREFDNFIPTLLADDLWNLPSHDMGLFYSGGNLLAGAGRHGFTTSLVTVENPDMDNTHIAELYGSYQGIDTLHIFPQLPQTVDLTGHVDMWMYLVDQDTVVISEFIPGSNPTAITITNDAATYMQGLGYTVHRVPDHNSIHPVEPTIQTHFTYANAIRVNDRIFIPSYGDDDPSHLARDAQALAVWQVAAPGLEIIQIPSYDVIYAAGGPHCIVKQVPSYTDPGPSAVVLSPVGGELLVAGTVHEILWGATDDVGIDSVDLYYSTDGGATFPGIIALGETHDGSFDWTVPPEDTATAIVKVVAHDADANSDEALSAAAFSIDTYPQHLYDFSTGAGVDRWAWGFEWPIFSSIETVRYPSTVTVELTAAQYSAISASDSTVILEQTDPPHRYDSPRPQPQWRSTHVFEFEIDEDPASIVDIELLWEGHLKDCTQIEMYVWDDVEGRWCDGRGQCGENRFVDNWAGNRDEAVRGNIRQDFHRYVDTNGLLTIILYAEWIEDKSHHDYVSVKVTHDPCLVAADADGDGVGEICDNCPGLANASQADGDSDGVGDLCDNCPTMPNTDQLNDDPDPAGNVCDCAPLDGGTFAVPFEIGNVQLATETSLTWDSDAGNSGSSVTYDVVRADIGDYPAAGASETCLIDGSAATSLAVPATPASGTGYYYLVRGTNPCGPGGFGATRVSTVCD